MTHERPIEESLQQQMEQAALLPEHDPARQAVVDRVRQAGPAAHAQWASLLEQTERLRLMSQDVTTPSNLAERLRAIPGHVQARRSRRIRWPGPAAASTLAAACLLIVALAGLSLLRSAGPDFEHAASEVVRLTIHDHRQQPALSFATDNPRAVADHLQPGVHFPIRVPDMPADKALAGGRVCSFDGRPLAYTRWHDHRLGRAHSLYQLCIHDFNLPEDFVPRRIDIPATPDHPQPLAVTLWPAGDDCAFALVEEQPPHEPERLSLRTR